MRGSSGAVVVLILGLLLLATPVGFSLSPGASGNPKDPWPAGNTSAKNVTIVLTAAPPAGSLALTSPVTWTIGVASAVGSVLVVIYVLRRLARRRARREERIP